MLGNYTATQGDSTLTQTFVAPAGVSSLTVQYKMRCPDTLSNDWAEAFVMDDDTGQTFKAAPVCATMSAWGEFNLAVIGGDRCTLTLVNHDNGNPSTPSYTFFDDITFH